MTRSFACGVTLCVVAATTMMSAPRTASSALPLRPHMRISLMSRTSGIARWWLFACTPVPRIASTEASSLASSFVATATKTWSFEPDFEGWKVADGTFTRENTGGGAPPQAPLTFYVRSSSLADSICDRLQSPVVRLSST